MFPSFARDPRDVVECFNDCIKHTTLDRQNPEHALMLFETPLYFISGPMGQTLATISKTFPLTAASLPEAEYGFLVFQRPTLPVIENDIHVNASGLTWGAKRVWPFCWDPPH